MLKTVKFGLVLTAVAAASILGSVSSVKANSIEIADTVASPVSIGSGLYEWTYNVTLTGSGSNPYAFMVNNTSFVEIYGVGPVSGVTVTGLLGSSYTSSNAGGNLLIDYTGSTITGSTGTTNTNLGTIVFDTTLSGFQSGNYASQDMEASSKGGGVYAATPFGPALTDIPAPGGGTPLATPLPAGFGSGLTGLAIVGLAAMKLRRKAAV
jgi:hypothetical protein